MESGKISSSHWLVAITKHYASAFIIADYFLKKEGTRCLEISALGKQGLLIFEINEKLSPVDYKIFLGNFNDQLEKQIIIENLPAEVIKSYLSLENSNADNFLLFLEFDFLGEALMAAQNAVSRGLKIVDFRFIRSSNSVTHLILTGAEEAEGQSFRKECVREYPGVSQPQLLAHPAAEIKNFFEIFPS